MQGYSYAKDLITYYVTWAAPIEIALLVVVGRLLRARDREFGMRMRGLLASLACLALPAIFIALSTTTVSASLNATGDIRLELVAVLVIWIMSLGAIAYSLFQSRRSIDYLCKYYDSDKIPKVLRIARRLLWL